MRILLVSDSNLTEHESQTELITNELLKIGFNVDVTDSLNPIRLILNKYDLIHFLNYSNSKILKYNFDQLISLTVSKTLKIPTLMSVFSQDYLLQSQIQLHLVDALTAVDINSLKKFKNFTLPKTIFPLIPQLKENFNLNNETFALQNTAAFLFPIEVHFSEILKFENRLKLFQTYSHEVFIDGSRLKQKYSSSEIRKKWQYFIKKNSIGKNLILTLEPMSILNNNFKSPTKVYNEQNINKIYIDCSHLELTHSAFTHYIENFYLSSHFILNENQATGLPLLWKNSIHFVESKLLSHLQNNKKLSVFIQQTLSDNDLDYKLEKNKLTNLFKSSIDVKFNELARLYTQVIHQKTVRLNHKPANM